MARVAGELSGRAAVAPALQPDAEAGWLRRIAELGGRGFINSFSLLLVAVAWEMAARAGIVTPFLLPSLSTVVERIWSDAQSGDLVVNLGLTLYRALFGFAISAVLGIALGVLIARIAAVRWFFDPVISVGFPMPKIAFLPVVMLWFGLYDVSKITMVSFDAIFPVITATVAATQAVDQQMLWSARMLGAGKKQLLWEIILPAASPQIMTGLQIALPIAVIVDIVCEMLMGGQGLGGAMIAASRFADSPGVFAGIVEIAIAGYCLVHLMAKLRKRLLIWHQEAEPPTTV
jgi:ABC-type nitrate/sulfonate/bicarbonate transport system permease component